MEVKDIGPIALSLGIGALVLAVMVMILGGFIPSTYQTSQINTTFSANSTYLDARQGWVGVIGLYNTTNDSAKFLIPTTNYSINGTYWLNITDVAAMNVGGTRMVLFQAKTYSNSTNVVVKMTLALGTLADWYPIVIVVLVATMILTLILYFGSKQQSSA